MIKWIKKDGREIETNDLPANIEAATNAGWVPVEDAPELDNRGLPWDERLNQKNRAKTEHGNWKYKQGVTAESAVDIEIELLESLKSD